MLQMQGCIAEDACCKCNEAVNMQRILCSMLQMQCMNHVLGVCNLKEMYLSGNLRIASWPDQDQSAVPSWQCQLCCA